MTGVAKVAVLSLLATQFIIFGLEIRAVGFRSWLRESQQSYIGYIRRYGRREWYRFTVIFVVVFMASWASVVIWRFA